jgi:hypothetical protein
VTDLLPLLLLLLVPFSPALAVEPGAVCFVRMEKAVEDTNAKCQKLDTEDTCA